MTDPIDTLRSGTRRLLKRLLPKGSKAHTKVVFDEIYREGRWGEGGDDGFCSGSGSHRDDIVRPYVSAVSEFLVGLHSRPRVLDLGCGDFNVGRQLRPLCGPYTGCDIVDALIERNRRRFAEMDVSFQVLDLVNDAWPQAEGVFIRQVLQHLSNDQIARVVGKLSAFRWALITEHLPADIVFPANNDKPVGEQIRMQQQPPSGVVLHDAPFGLASRSRTVLCDVPADGGRIVSTLYAFE